MFVVAFLTSISTLVAAWSSGETTGFDAASIPFWLGAGLNATGVVFQKVQIRGTVAVTHLILVILGSYILFSNELILIGSAVLQLVGFSLIAVTRLN